MVHRLMWALAKVCHELERERERDSKDREEEEREERGEKREKRREKRGRERRGKEVVCVCMLGLSADLLCPCEKE